MMNNQQHHSHQQTLLLLAWLVALLAVLGTQYAEIGLGLPICHLCWYQRVCIYPLVIILGIGAFRDDGHCRLYAIPLIVLGLFFSVYQYLQQMIPGFAPINFCGAGADCASIHMKLLGFITWPFLSIIACLLMLALLVVAPVVLRPRP